MSGLGPAAIHQTLVDGRDECRYSAAVCEIGSSTEVVVADAVGTLAWGGEPVAQQTPFDVASVTKPVVGLLGAVLLDAGRLSLQGTVAALLPEYAGTDKAEITVEQLLTHTSGIPGPVPLDAAVETYVARPLGMDHTGFGLPASAQATAAATERCTWRGRLVQGTVHDENADVLGGVAGHAGLFSTAGDLGRLCRMMLRHGIGPSGRLLSEPAVAAMTRPRTNHLNLRRCLAWRGRDVIDCPAGDLVSDQSYGHTGFTGTSIWIDPVLDTYVVLLTNAVHPRRDPSRISAFRRRFHDAAISALLPEPSGEVWPGAARPS